MLDLALVLALADAGLCEYGTTGFCASSPILDDGTVTSDSGLWVTVTPSDNNKATKTATVSIQTRADDVIYQGLLEAHLVKWVDTVLPSLCDVSCNPILDITYSLVSSSTASTPSLQSVDSEGHYVKQIEFTLSYKAPETLPALSDYTVVQY